MNWRPRTGIAVSCHDQFSTSALNERVVGNRPPEMQDALVVGVHLGFVERPIRNLPAAKHSSHDLAVAALDGRESGQIAILMDNGSGRLVRSTHEHDIDREPR